MEIKHCLIPHPDWQLHWQRETMIPKLMSAAQKSAQIQIRTGSRVSMEHIRMATTSTSSQAFFVFAKLYSNLRSRALRLVWGQPCWVWITEHQVKWKEAVHGCSQWWFIQGWCLQCLRIMMLRTRANVPPNHVYVPFINIGGIVDVQVTHNSMNTGTPPHPHRRGFCVLREPA